MPANNNVSALTPFEYENGTGAPSTSTEVGLELTPRIRKLPIFIALIMDVLPDALVLREFCESVQMVITSGQNSMKYFVIAKIQSNRKNLDRTFDQSLVTLILYGKRIA